MRKQLENFTLTCVAHVRGLYRAELPRSEINVWFTDTVLPELASCTKGGRAKYTAAEKQHVISTFSVTMLTLECELTVYGYWYKNEFYARLPHQEPVYVWNANIKPLNDLHEQGLTQGQWDKLQTGMYYKASLKPFDEIGVQGGVR